MTMKEALTLKKGDLVVLDDRNKHYGGIVLEVESILDGDNWCRRVTLKQPYFDQGFRLRDYDSRHLRRFEG